MSNVIEKNVVKMEFDNSDFEKKTKESMSTIEKLKKSLNFDKAKETLSGFATAANNLDFSALTDQITTISKRFSNLGIAGMTVVSRLTNSVIDGVSKISRSIANMTIQGGISRAMNLEKAKFQLEGLKVSWYQIQDDIDYGVKDTAYGLDAAANVASQLVTSGVAIGDDMRQSLRAISGVASMTGSTYEEIGHIFTSVAGQGKVMTMQLRELELRGLNAAGKLAEAMGKTEAEIRDMVTKGQIDFATFAKAMDDAFGEHAKDSNKTLTGTLSNIRSAWARIGAEFIQPVIRNEGELVELLNAYRLKVNELKASIVPVAEKVTGVINTILKSGTRIVNSIDIKGKLDGVGDAAGRLITSFVTLFYRLQYFGRQISNIFREIFPKKQGKSIKDSIDAITNAINHFSIDSKTVEKFKDVFRGLFSLAKVGVIVFKNLLTIFKPLGKYIANEAGSMLDIAAAIGRIVTKLTEGTLKAEDFELTFAKFADNISVPLNKIREGIFNLVNSIESSEKGTKFVLDSIVDIVSGAVETILTIIGQVTGIDMSYLIGNLNEFSKDLKYFLKTLYDIYEEAGGGAKGLVTVIWKVLKDISDKIVKFVKDTTGLDLSALKDKLVSWFEFAAQKIDEFIEKVKPIEKIKEKVLGVNDTFKRLSETLHGLAGSAAKGIGKMLENPVGSIVGLHGAMAVIDRINQLLRDGHFGSIPQTLFDIKKSLSNFMASMNARTIATTAAAIVAFAISLDILAGAVAKLANTENFDNTLGSLGEVLGLMAGVMISLVITLRTLQSSTTDINNSAKGLKSSFKSIKSLSSLNIVATAITIVAIAEAVKIMADALSEVATMDANLGDHILGVIEVFGLLAMLGEALKTLASKIPKNGVTWKMFITYSVTMVIIAKAVQAMADAFATINEATSKITDLGDLINVLLSFGIVIGLLASIVYSLNKIKIANVQNMALIGIGVYSMAQSVGILVKAITMLKDIDAEHGLMGLVTVFVLLYEVMQAASVVAGKAIGLKTSFSLLAMAGAIAILVHQINVLAKTPFDDIIKGFITIAAMLTAFTIAASFFQNELSGLKNAGFAMLEFAGSMWIVTEAINSLASIHPLDILKGCVALVATLGLLVAIAKEANGIKESGFAILEMSAGLYIIAQALSLIGGMDIFELVKGFGILIGTMQFLVIIAEQMTAGIAGAQAMIIMAGAIGILAVALALLTPLGPAILIAGGALVAFITILSVVAVGMAGVGPLMVTGATYIMIATLMISAGLLGVVGVAALFGAALALIAVSATAAADGFKVFAETLVTVAVESVKNVKAMALFTTCLLKASAAMALGAVALLGMAVGLAAFGAGALVAAVGAAALGASLYLLGAALDYIVSVLERANLIEIINQTGLKQGAQYPKALAQGIQSGEDVVKGSMNSLAKKALGSFNNEMGINSPSTVMMENGKFIDMGLAEGIDKNSNLVEIATKALGEDTAKNLTTELTKGTSEGSKTLEEAVKQFATMTEKGSESAGVNTGIGFLKGLSSQKGNIMKYASNLAASAIGALKQRLKIKSPSRVAMEVGEYTGEGFAIGMHNSESTVSDSAETLGKTAENSLTTALSAAYDNLTSGIDDPTITPVLDLSNIQNGASSIDSMLSKDYASDIAANYKSDRDYTAEQSQANASLMSGLNDRLVSAINSNDMSNLPINLSVQLVGDADGVFRLVLGENQRWINMTGASPLMRG